MELLNLDASTIPLKGRHLIEASAGTGKTYNITRIYLRLLLEKELTVEQILLMTFTKDATQELRGRIDTFIRDALNNWSTLCQQDTYFKSIDDRVDPAKREFMLKRALLFLDEASIFTIHGFCQRALTQHAFSSGLSFNSNMSTDSTLLALEACQDWYRQLAKQGDESFNLVAQFWAHPNSFMSSFGKAITHDSDITVEDVSTVTRHVTSLAVDALTSIETDITLLNEQLITHKKPEEVDKRREELNALILWLKVVANLDKNNLDETELRAAIKSPLPSYLLNANRYPKAFKETISNVLSPCKTLKKVLDSFVKDIDKAKAYFIVKQAILQIRQQVANKKILLNTLDFDDLINTLSQCVSPILDGKGEVRQTILAKKLLAQFPVALVE
jgi:exodeoxyribonuclease V beta subunit